MPPIDTGCRCSATTITPSSMATTGVRYVAMDARDDPTRPTRSWKVMNAAPVDSTPRPVTAPMPAQVSEEFPSPRIPSGVVTAVATSSAHHTTASAPFPRCCSTPVTLNAIP